MPTPITEEQIVRYLLDEVDGEQRAQLEERLFREPSFCEEVAAIEDDLIMQYVRGDMEDRLLPRFREVYLESPVKRARVESAQVLRQAVRDTAQRPVVGFPHRFVWLTAVAALVALALLFPRWKGHIPGGGHGQDGNHAEIAFSLEPDLQRSGGGVEIHVPKATLVHLRLAVAAPVQGKNYRVSLGTPERPDMWSGTGVLQGSEIITTLPADVLIAGDYSLQLQAADSDNHWENIAVYYFRVVG